MVSASCSSSCFAGRRGCSILGRSWDAGGLLACVLCLWTILVAFMADGMARSRTTSVVWFWQFWENFHIIPDSHSGGFDWCWRPAGSGHSKYFMLEYYIVGSKVLSAPGSTPPGKMSSQCGGHVPKMTKYRCQDSCVEWMLRENHHLHYTGYIRKMKSVKTVGWQHSPSGSTLNLHRHSMYCNTFCTD